jgi:hypothetical protein
MATLRSSASTEDAHLTQAAITRLQEATATHLEHEEAELEPIYLAHREAPEIKAMGKEFGKVSPTVGGVFFEWVRDGATPEELAAIEGSVPKPVLTIIGGLFGRRYRREVAPVWAA